jgi:hypothetical protein
MTQLRHCKCDNSNYFDRVYEGLGHRGSSFSDIDGVTHDAKTQRFLFQEFKQEGEPINPAQHWMLRDLATAFRKVPDHFTIWLVVRRHDGCFDWAVYGDELRTISLEELQQRFVAWWENREWQRVESTRDIPPPPPPQPVVAVAAPVVQVSTEATRRASAARMSVDQLQANLQLMRDAGDNEDGRIWIRILETELHSRHGVGVQGTT